MITFESLDLPVVLSQPTTDKGWIRTREATWPDLLAGAKQRWESVRHVEAEAEAFDRALDQLRPIMRQHPSMTVAEALMVANSEVA
jgi:hypothetical protein